MIAFILSHNRVENCPTLNMLNNFNYSGDYRIVVDSEDKQLDDYKLKYADKLIVFNKEDYLYKEDTAFSKDKLLKSSPFYARIFVDEYAKDNNVGDYLVLDDDIKDLRIRFPNYESQTLKTYKISNFNLLLGNLFTYLNECNLYAMSFAHSGMFIGGISNFDKIIHKRVASNIFLFNSNRQLKWKTIFYDDLNTCLSNGITSKLVFTIPFIQISAEEQGGQLSSQNKDMKNNGMGDAYFNTTQFQRSFYSAMLFPSSCSVKQVGDCAENLWPSIKLDNQFQKIISDKFKL